MPEGILVTRLDPVASQRSDGPQHPVWVGLLSRPGTVIFCVPAHLQLTYNSRMRALF